MTKLKTSDKKEPVNSSVRKRSIAKQYKEGSLIRMSVRRKTTQKKSNMTPASTIVWRTELTEDEKNAIANMRKKEAKKSISLMPNEISEKDIAVAYLKQSNYTIAIIRSAGKEYVGVSMRNKSDVPNPITGKMYAFTRALKAQVGLPIQ